VAAVTTDGRLPEDPAAELERWEVSGGTWRVDARTAEGLEVALCTCDGQEMARISSADAALAAYVGDRRSSED
jgi:hypothetical protein